MPEGTQTVTNPVDEPHVLLSEKILQQSENQIRPILLDDPSDNHDFHREHSYSFSFSGISIGLRFIWPYRCRKMRHQDLRYLISAAMPSIANIRIKKPKAGNTNIPPLIPYSLIIISSSVRF
jgi:hypothetical protein